jgi:predicted transposase YbfD/YdcC
MASLYETVGRLHDPRVKKRSKHLLSDIVILAVLAVTSGAESYDAIEEFGKYHLETLRKRLRLPNGIPSHDTVNRVFQMINFRQFERLFLEWAEGLKPERYSEKAIAIDGKTVRGSRDGYHDNPAIHLVHAWSVENGLCLGQRKTRDKSNEITAIPELLDMLCIEGTLITIDAMGTQTAMAEKIMDGKADYILALKGNQGTLLQDAELMEKEVRPVAESEEVDKGHGRVETRRCAVYEPTEWIRDNHRRKGLRTIVKLTATRWNAISKEEVSETRW